jgi:hypothetical protein
VVRLAGGPLDPRDQALGGPFDLPGLGGILLAANQLALAVTTLAVVAAAGSLVGRFSAAPVERLQLRGVAWAAVLAVLGAVAVGVRGPPPRSAGRSGQPGGAAGGDRRGDPAVPAP